MVELFSKWRKYVPPINQTDSIYKDPGEAIMKEIRDKRNGNRKAEADAAAAAAATAAPEDTVENVFAKV